VGAAAEKAVPFKRFALDGASRADPDAPARPDRVGPRLPTAGTVRARPASPSAGPVELSEEDRAIYGRASSTR
jgi:hypothetical protein